MSGKIRSVSQARAFALGLALVGMVVSSAAQAASINYGNFGPIPPGIAFLNVTETAVTDPVPLYGPPSLFPVGLDFNPAGFLATSAGGGADLTDGQLNFTVAAGPNGNISGIGLFESGDYTLAGVGTATTEVKAGASLAVTVTHVNGAPVAPIVLTPASGSVAFNLAANAGIVQPWSLGASVGINLGPGQRATRVDVVIDNAMLAVSQTSSLSYIAKKEFIIDVDTQIPEPATFALTAVALCGLGAMARKRS